MPERQEYAPGTPSWVDLGTTDLDAAKDFYAGIFGWDLEDSPVPGGTSYTMASREGMAVAGMMDQTAEQVQMGVPPAWNTYVTVTDAGQALAAAEAAGGTVIVPAMDVMEAGRMGVFTDPLGGACCVWEPQGHIGAQLVNEHGTLTWNDLMTDDPAGSASFYADLFNWDAAEVPGPGDGAPGQMFLLDGAPVASASPAPAGVPTHWSVYFAVDDCDACADAIGAGGGQVTVGPMDIPPGRMAAAVDPTGAHFNVIALNPEFDPLAA